MKNIYQFIGILLVPLVLFHSCKKDDQFKSLQVYTNSVTDITSSSIQVEGKIQVGGKADIFEAGFCWSRKKSPSVLDNRIIAKDAIGSYNNEERVFKLTLDSLLPNQTYYIRSYAIYNDFLVYGNELTFTTLQDYTPFFTFGENYKAKNVVVGYVDSMNALIFNNQDNTADMGVIQFGGGLQASKTYDVVASTFELKENEAQVSNFIINDFYWNSVGEIGNKIYTEEVNGKIVVKFNKLKLKNSSSPKLENTLSGLLIVEK
ncbi:MAG TPA: hypothetical protein VLZ75_06345 [Chitinophagales bacterium]|nr:hypothetical protein [Chitinophagales bacterium]